MVPTISLGDPAINRLLFWAALILGCGLMVSDSEYLPPVHWQGYAITHQAERGELAVDGFLILQ